MGFIQVKYKIIAQDSGGQKFIAYKFGSSKKEIIKFAKSIGLRNIKVKREIESFNDIRIGGNGKLKTSELLDFLINLYDMVKLAIPVYEAIAFMKKISTKESLKEFYGELLNDIKSGITLSKALENSKKVDNYVVLLLRTAEQTGELEKGLEELISYYRDKDEILNKIKTALIKPAFILTMLTGAFLFIVIAVIPKLYNLIKANPKVQVPFITDILYHFGFWVKNYSFLAIGIVMGVFFVIRYIIKHPKYGQIIYKIPIIKRLKKYEFETEFLMSLYLLIKSGTSVNTALDMLYQNETRPFIRNTLKNIKTLYQKGLPFSKIIAKYNYLFDPLIGFMFEKGERAGTLEEITEKLYFTYKIKVKRFLEKFPDIITNVTLIIGGGILLLAFMGILQPVVAFIQSAS